MKTMHPNSLWALSTRANDRGLGHEEWTHFMSVIEASSLDYKSALILLDVVCGSDARDHLLELCIGRWTAQHLPEKRGAKGRRRRTARAS